MKEINEDIEENIIIEEKIEKKDPPLVSKPSNESELNSLVEAENRKKEKRREISHSYWYNFKDYIFFFSLLLSSSMNFSYLYLPLIFAGIYLKFFIGKNNLIQKSRKLNLEYFCLSYSVLLLIFKITCLVLIENKNEFISNHSDIFLDLGICYLRKNHTSLYFVMTFLGESIVIFFSLYSIIINNLCNKFSLENDTSLLKNHFWTSRNLIILNYFFYFKLFRF